VADAFDALLSARHYKSALAPREVLALLKRGQGRDWDSVVVRALVEIVDEVLRDVYGREAGVREDDGPMERAA